MESFVSYLFSHPAFVHFPIAFTLLSLLLSFFRRILNEEKWNSFFSIILILTSVSFLPALFSGYYASDLLAPSQKNSLALDLHKNIMMWSAVSIWALTLLYHNLKSPNKDRFHWGFFIALFSVSVMIMYGAMLGGRLVFDFGFGVDIK